MKKYFFLLAALLIICSCAMAAPSKRLPKFSKLHVQNIIEVHFVQGTGYACRFTSPDPSLDKFVRTEVTNDTLKVFVTGDEEYNEVYRRMKEKYHEVKVSLEVTAPQLEAVSVTSVSAFTAGALNVKNFHLTVSRVSRATIDRLEVSGRAQIELQDVSKATIGSLQCADLRITEDKVSELTFTRVEARRVEWQLDQVSKGNVNETLNCDSLRGSLDRVSAFKLNQISARGDVSVDCNSASRFEGTIKAQGRATVTLDGTSKGLGTLAARDVVIKTKGTSQAEFDLDCKNLEVENERVSRVKLSGSADKVNIDTSILSNVDTSELNKY